MVIIASDSGNWEGGASGAFEAVLARAGVAAGLGRAFGASVGVRRGAVGLGGQRGLRAGAKRGAGGSRRRRNHGYGRILGHRRVCAEALGFRMRAWLGALGVKEFFCPWGCHDIR